MKRLTAQQTRRAFLDYFVRNGHTEVASSSLIPANDPTLLFANAGMVQFTESLWGLELRPSRRAPTAQKCLRVSGKHNDLEEVGPSPRHHTFFEMLGNFSFGDYFKQDAIRFAWEFLTTDLALPVERLWFTVFAGSAQVPPDEEAERLWIETGAAPDRVLRFGEKDNFWVMGDTGPCGPCSEITIYIGDDLTRMRADGVNSDDPDYVEIWNLVFMQFDRATMQPLPRPSVDTGMGLERIAMVLQGVESTYQTDLFEPIIEHTMALTGGDRDHYRQYSAAYRAVADHARACTFLIADGILPGNEGRSYVLRRVLRRAAYQGRTIGLTRPFLAGTAGIVIEIMGDAYPQLRARRAFILETLQAEEERFGRTISSGLLLLDQALATLPAGGQLSGDQAFALYDTHGFPLDLTEKIVTERGMRVDLAGYETRMEEQREKARRGATFKRGREAAVWAETDRPATTFIGYTAFAG
jgi:alanyl-tRNA synthetase